MLAIIGPARDHDEYFEDFMSAVAETSGVHYISPVAHQKLIAAIQQATVLLNTSISEGASNAILEAMDLGTPV